jgi:hypothetical protein
LISFGHFTKLIFLFNCTFQPNIKFILFFNFDPYYFKWYFFKSFWYLKFFFDFDFLIFDWLRIELHDFYRLGVLGWMTQVMGLKSNQKYFFYQVILILWSGPCIWRDILGWLSLDYRGLQVCHAYLGWSRPIFYVFLIPFRSFVFNGLWIEMHYLFVLKKQFP